jgi:hypothetical protein
VKSGETVITWSMICAFAFSVGARLYESSGHSWVLALLGGAAALVVALVVLMVLGLLAGILHEAIQFAKERPSVRRRERIEARFPGTRVTPYGEGKWLVTDIATGSTSCEIAQDGVTVIAPNGRTS